MKSYGQYCAIARALDVVGDRWTLLIVRELLLAGPSRFTDIKRGLPGVATNLLSSRLKELEAAGLVAHEDAPPPVAAALYELTADGRALKPAVRALGLWGLRLMDDAQAGDVFQAHWLAYAPLWFANDAEPSGQPAVIQLDANGEKAVIELRGGRIHTRVGLAESPDLVISGSPRAVLGIVTGASNKAQRPETAATLRGRTDLLKRLTRAEA